MSGMSPIFMRRISMYQGIFSATRVHESGVNNCISPRLSFRRTYGRKSHVRKLPRENRFVPTFFRTEIPRIPGSSRSGTALWEGRFCLLCGLRTVKAQFLVLRCTQMCTTPKQFYREILEGGYLGLKTTRSCVKTRFQEAWNFIPSSPRRV